MALIETDALLQAVPGEAPCGTDLEYDPAFMELDRSARSAPQERAVGPTNTSDGPDWRGVREQALGLLGRTKDVRVGVVLVRSLLHTAGLAGFEAGVAVLNGLITRYWDTIHPQLSAEDDNNPLMRINALKELCDRSATLNVLRASAIVSLSGLGTFSLRDIAIAKGELTPVGADGQKPDMSKIDAAFSNAPLEQLEATLTHAKQAHDHVRALEQFVTDKVGVHFALDLEELRAPLKQITTLVGDHVARRRAAEAGPEAGASSSNGKEASGQARGGVALGAIASRADVVRVLDRLCEYYERYEPASPVPILLRRAQRLVPMSFLDIVRDLAPAGVSEIETIRGPEAEK